MSTATRSEADFVRDAYGAFARGEVAAVLAMLDDDVEWNVPDVLPHGGHARGRDAVGAFFGRLAELWSDFGLDVDIVTGADGRGIGIGRAHGRLRGADSGDGFTHVFTLRDNRVVRFDEYVAPPEGGFPE